MEHAIKTHADGIVGEIFCNAGDMVNEGDVFLTLDENKDVG